MRAVVFAVTVLAVAWCAPVSEEQPLFIPFEKNSAKHEQIVIQENDADRSTDAEFQTLVDNMRAQDADKPSSSQYKLSWGNKLGSNPKPTTGKLISSCDESLFSKSTYSALKKVYDNNIFTADVCVDEIDYNSGMKKSILQGVLDAWANTKPFSLMHDYLVKKGKVSSDMTAFKSFLYTFWFDTYSRCANNKKKIGSSGFEHVFSGEFKDDTIDGHHNWMKYYLDQKAGNIKYYGYYSYDGSLTGTFEYDWSDHNKKTGGMLFGTSPVFDFSLYTACAMVHPGSKTCRFTIDGYQLAVTSYTQDCKGGGLCLSTAYPVASIVTGSRTSETRLHISRSNYVVCLQANRPPVGPSVERTAPNLASAAAQWLFLSPNNLFDSHIISISRAAGSMRAYCSQHRLTKHAPTILIYRHGKIKRVVRGKHKKTCLNTYRTALAQKNGEGDSVVIAGSGDGGGGARLR